MRRLPVLVTLVALMLATGPASATARTLGLLPPHHPAADCGGWGLSGIDKCRVHEGLGKLVLPTNWSRLNADQRLLVLVDLERVNRGLAPVPVLLAPLNRLALRGARAHTDPPFPTCHCLTSGGGVFASVDPPSILEADQLWMYSDAGSGWGHRATILTRGAKLVGGAGATRDSWDFEVLAGYRYKAAQVTFRWAKELHYFKRRPGLDPLH